MPEKSKIFLQDKRQKSLIFVFFGIISAIFLILYFGYFGEKKELPKPTFFEFLPKEIRLNLEIFDEPIFKLLQPLPPLSFPLNEEIGKEDIFKWE